MQGFAFSTSWVDFRLLFPTNVLLLARQWGVLSQQWFLYFMLLFLVFNHILCFPFHARTVNIFILWDEIWCTDCLSSEKTEQELKSWVSVLHPGDGESELCSPTNQRDVLCLMTPCLTIKAGRKKERAWLELWNLSSQVTFIGQWTWLSTCLQLESNELIPYLALILCIGFVFSAELSSSGPRIFFPSACPIPLPHPTTGEQVSDCVGLSFLLGLLPNKYLKTQVSFPNRYWPLGLPFRNCSDFQIPEVFQTISQMCFFLPVLCL